MRPVLIVSALIFVCSQTQAQDSTSHYRKDDPITKKHIVQIDAQSFHQIKEENAKFLLSNMTARLYDVTGSIYKRINSKQAIVDEKLGTITYGPTLNRLLG